MSSLTTQTRHLWTCVLFAPALLVGCEGGAVLVGRTSAPSPDAVERPRDPAADTSDGDADVDVDPGPPGDCDRDDDGWDSPACGGPDCDDDDPETRPDAIEPEEWNVEVIATDASWPALAMDGQGHAHVAMRAVVAGAPTLLYVTNQSGDWQSSEVASIGEGALAPSIAVGADRRVHLCWTAVRADGTSEIVYATNTGRAWRSETLASSAGSTSACAAAVDLRGFVHVAATDPLARVLRYAVLAGGAWTIDTVDGHVAAQTRPTLLVDVQYMPSIGYQSGDDGALRYATRSPTGWYLDTLVGAGLSVDRSLADFALAPDGSVRVSYRDLHLRSLRFATNEAGGWDSVALESAGYSGKSSTVAVDGNGATHVAYSRDDRFDRPDDLSFRTDAAGDWSAAQTIDDEGSTGFAPQLAVGPHSLHVVFFRVGVADQPEVLHGRRPLPDALDRDCDGEL